MENLIERINAKGSEIRYNETSILLKKREDFEENLENIKKLGERISKMWDIAQTLLDNGFPLGETISDICGFKHWTLETDGFYHGIGFVVKRPFGNVRGQIVSFGIEGGGYSGSDFFVNKNGDALLPEKTFGEDSDGYVGRIVPVFLVSSITSKAREFVMMFDEYERKFYEYAEMIAA